MASYHVTLDGQGYMLELAKYVRRAHEPFVPRVTAGDRRYGDLAHDQGLLVSDWSGGEGFLQLDPDATSRYRTGTGVDWYSQPGALGLGPLMPQLKFWSADAPTCALVYKGSLYVGVTSQEVYRWDGTTWTLSLGAMGYIPAAMATFLNKLYVTSGSDGKVASFDGTTWTNPAFTIAGSGGSAALATFYRQTAQYLYVGTSGTGPNGVGSVYWWDGATLSAKQYDFEETSPQAAVVLGNRLYFFVGSSDGRGAIYSVDDSGLGGVYRAHVARSDGYWRSAVVWNGLAYLGDVDGGRIWTWDGSQARQVYQLGSQASAYAAPIYGLGVWNGALWAAIQDGAGGSGLLRYDGRAWSRPVVGLTGGDPRWVVVYGGKRARGVGKTGDARAYRTDGTYGASGTLETGLFDGRLPSVDKVLRSVTVTHSALLTGQSVQVQYQLEGTGSWTALGTSSTVGVTSATFSFVGLVTARQVAFRLVLGGTSGGSSSVALYDWLLRYALAPDLKREWELEVVLEGTPGLPQVTLDGTAKPRTGAQHSANLWTSKAKAGPVTFVDLDGVSRSAWFVDLKEGVEQLSQRKGYQTVGRCRLLEA